MSKSIVFCADGTWNSPNEDENNDSTPDPTNVYKLFMSLAGSFSGDSIRAADEQEKELCDSAKVTTQIAKYLHGVGDSRNPICRLMGGAFGSGIITRIVRGYTFISRNYQEGDCIVVLGFSRGAYTARALAGLIASQGLLDPALTEDKEIAYRRGAEAWYRYRKASESRPPFLARLAEVASDLPAFLSSGTLKAKDFVSVETIKAVAVWDTVGALGIPEYVGDQRVDAFRFADTKLSDKVHRGFHAVALDERRCDFCPTLWDAAPNVTQLLFSGAHADVGGGYPTVQHQSGLSDVALMWMIGELKDLGVSFAEDLCSPPPLPDICGVAHMPWKHGPWMEKTRAFPKGMEVHQSVRERMAAGPVVAEPGAAPQAYAPGNIPAP